ncbi:transient receptor potential cation channel subfamily M member 2-like [Amphiura filiformis]|uniref:transient receptor potential cation channel subfamily M member 2-like n=1 Tax=Amphiura filiformis TaxID=82378 RepID=UPI003B2147E7
MFQEREMYHQIRHQHPCRSGESRCSKPRCLPPFLRVSFGRGIQVGYVGEKAFMTCDHRHEVGIKFLGFKTDIGISGVWEFCTFGYEQFETPDTYKYRYDAVPKLTADKPSITFRLKADDKAYLALSPKKKDVQDMIEIVLSNNLSEMRIGRGNKHVAKESTPDLLSPDEFRQFYLTFEQGRSIQVGRLGQKPFLKYKPSKPIHFDFLGFASDVACKGVWEFPVLGTSEHQSTSGVYKYNFLFPPLPQTTEMITFHVKAASNALIALSPEDKPSDDMYEIMLGLDKNQKSGITYEGKFNSHITTEKILTADSFKHFYIYLQDDMIQVGVVGEKPFMKCERKTDVKFVGFCSDHKSPAIWDFCMFGRELFETSKYHFDLPRVPRDRKIVTFRVKAKSDAYLAMRSDKEDDMYEIELCGTGSGMSRSALKYGQQQAINASTPHLSDEEFRHFYIYIDPKKPIQVGEVGQKPFLKHKSTKPFIVKEIGFGTGHDVSGVWEFCTFEFLDGDILPDPTRQLLLYSILNKYYDMAEYFWEEGQEHIAAALTASKMYKVMAKGQHTELKELLYGIAQKYEDLAYGILTECEDQTEGQDTLDLLIRISPNWGYRNHLSLAEDTESRRFMSHPAVQVLLGKIWREGLPTEGQDKTQPLHRDPISNKTIGYKRIGDQSSDEDEVEKTTPLRTGYVQEDYEEEQPKGCWQKTKQFLDAPRTKFWINLVMYIVFLIFFSYVMVSDQLSKKRPSEAESFLIFWVVTFITEEVRQLVQPDMGRRVNKGRKRLRNITIKAKSQIREYMSNYWNWIDIVMLLLFVLGEIIRLSPNGRSPGRIVLAFSLFMFYLRFLHFLTISKNIGPKVFMIFKMLGDLRFMIIILVIILVGYGVAVQAILYPHVTDVSSVVKGILFRPTFQIYGELFLDDVTASQTEGTCSGNALDPCPEHVGWGVFFLVVYMIISNVLLLNLLIAMFSNTYQRVQGETDLHAKFQRYSLTKEFFNRPLLPPPLIIFAHLYRLIRYILHKARILRWTIHRMERYFSDGDERSLIKMEERCAYNYIQRKRSDGSSR